MKIKEIAMKNLMRRRGKAAFVLAGLIIGVGTVVAIVSYTDAMTNDINHKLEKFGANILIIPRTDNLSLSYGGLSLGGVSFDMQQIRQADLASVHTIKNAANIAALGPIVLGNAQIKNNAVLIAGVDFEATRILRPWWKLNGSYPAKDQVIAGSEAARVLNLAPGGTLTVKGQTLAVSGLLEPTGSQDDHLLFTSIITAQTLFNKEGQITMAEVAALCNACPIEEMVKQISAALPGAKVMAIQQVVKGRMETLSQFRKFSFGVSIVVLLIGGMVVLVTLMGSVKERTNEIGIFRAIGFRKSQVIKIIVIEAGVVSALAGIFGFLFGLGGTKIGLQLFTQVPAHAVAFNLKLAGGAVLMSVLVGLIASAYPAHIAAKLDPNEAFRAL